MHCTHIILMTPLWGFFTNSLSWMAPSSTVQREKTELIFDWQSCKNIKFRVWLSNCQSQLICQWPNEFSSDYLYFNRVAMRLAAKSERPFLWLFTCIDAYFYVPLLKIQFSLNLNFHPFHTMAIAHQSFLPNSYYPILRFSLALSLKMIGTTPKCNLKPENHIKVE